MYVHLHICIIIYMCVCVCVCMCVCVTPIEVLRTAIIRVIAMCIIYIRFNYFIHGS